MKANIYNQAGENTGTLDLNQKIFGVEKIKPSVVHQVVTSLLSSARNTVASTKTKGEVRGGGKKPHAQKGTGRARAGSSRSPLWRGGGITFGPRPNRNFDRKINKKMKTVSLFSILSDKAEREKLVILEDLTLDAPKTKQLAALLKALQSKVPAVGRTTLVVISDKQKNLILPARNLPRVRIAMGNHLNVLDVLYADSIVVLKDALQLVEQTYLKKV